MTHKESDDVYEIREDQVEDFLTMAHNCHVNLLKFEGKEGDPIAHDYGQTTIEKDHIALRVQMPEDKKMCALFDYSWLAYNGWTAEGITIEVTRSFLPPPPEYLQ